MVTWRPRRWSRPVEEMAKRMKVGDRVLLFVRPGSKSDHALAAALREALDGRGFYLSGTQCVAPKARPL